MTASLLAEKASLDGGKLAGTTTSTFISEKTLGLCSGFSTEIVSDSNYNQVKKVLSDTTNYTQKHTDTTRVQNVTNDSPIKQSAPITIYPAGYDRNRKPFYGLTQEEKITKNSNKNELSEPSILYCWLLEQSLDLLPFQLGKISFSSSNFTES
jgi:hypothetical protein